MWIEFFLSAVFVAAILYLSSVLLLRSLKFSWIKSLICAPLISVFVYSMLAIAYAKMGLPTDAVSLVAPLVLFEVVVFGVLKLFNKSPAEKANSLSKKDLKQDFIALSCYVGFALVVTARFYLGTLDGPASFPQDSDNTWHLALIRSFVQSGNFSMLEANLFHDYETIDIAPIMPSSGAFYPAAWHLLAALCVQQFGVSVSLAANVVNTVFLATVLPSGMWMLFKAVFKENKMIVLLGSLLPLAFVAYPWGMLISVSGPLYPNFAGFAFVPIVVALFIELFDKKTECIRPAFFSQVVILCIGVCSMALLHPNAVFAAAIILVPYCVYRIIDRIRISALDRKRKVIFAALGCGVFLLIVLGIWIALFYSSFMHTTVSYKWAPYAGMHQEFINILTLAYKMPGTQLVLGAVVLVGIIYTFYQRKYLWMSAAYAISCFSCFISATSNGFLKSFLTGFWYTDVYRLGAMAALAAVPLAALGLYVVVLLIKRIARYVVSSDNQHRLARVTIAGFLLFFCVANFYPSFTVPGIGYVQTGFGDYLQCNSAANSYARPNLYDEEEKAFMEQVSEVVDPGFAIYNNADDGSPFAYAFEGLDLVYRRSAAQLLDGGETGESELLRNSINELATNEDVENALKNANIRYILVLDQGGEATDERCYYGYYTPAKWKGINAITDETPGLEILLSEGDMRLYEIDYEAFD